MSQIRQLGREVNELERYRHVSSDTFNFRSLRFRLGPVLRSVSASMLHSPTGSSPVRGMAAGQLLARRMSQSLSRVTKNSLLAATVIVVSEAGTSCNSSADHLERG